MATSSPRAFASAVVMGHVAGTIGVGWLAALASPGSGSGESDHGISHHARPTRMPYQRMANTALRKLYLITWMPPDCLSVPGSLLVHIP